LAEDFAKAFMSSMLVSRQQEVSLTTLPQTNAPSIQLHSSSTCGMQLIVSAIVTKTALRQPTSRIDY